MIFRFRLPEYHGPRFCTALGKPLDRAYFEFHNFEVEAESREEAERQLAVFADEISRVRNAEQDE